MTRLATVERLEMVKDAVRDDVRPRPRVSAPARGDAITIEDRWLALRATSLSQAARLDDLPHAAHECGSDSRAAALTPGHHRWRDLHLTAGQPPARSPEDLNDHLADLEACWTAIATEARARSRDLEEALGGRSRPVAVTRPAAPAVSDAVRELAA